MRHFLERHSQKYFDTHLTRKQSFFKKKNINALGIEKLIDGAMAANRAKIMKAMRKAVANGKNEFQVDVEFGGLIYRFGFKKEYGTWILGQFLEKN